MGGSSSKQPAGVNIQPQLLSGEWIEVGRYADFGEAACNNVKIEFKPVEGQTNLRVTRKCACHLTGREAFESGTTSTYVSTNKPGVFEISGEGRKVSVVHLDNSWALFADPNHLWVYRRPSVSVDQTTMAQLWNLVQLKGFDPSRVILTGDSVQRLAEHKIYSGSIPQPDCANVMAQVSNFGH